MLIHSLDIDYTHDKARSQRVGVTEENFMGWSAQAPPNQRIHLAFDTTKEKQEDGVARR